MFSRKQYRLYGHLAFQTALNDDLTRAIGNKDYNYMPAKNFSIPVDSARIVELGIVDVSEADQIVNAVNWTVSDGNGNPLQYVLKNQLAFFQCSRTTTGNALYISQ